MKTYLLTLLLAVFVLSPMASFGEYVQITGSVVDALGQPIVGTLISDPYNGFQTTTDVAGKYTLHTDYDTYCASTDSMGNCTQYYDYYYICAGGTRGFQQKCQSDYSPNDNDFEQMNFSLVEMPLRVPGDVTVVGSSPTSIEVSWVNEGGPTTGFFLAIAPGAVSNPVCNGSAINVGTATTYQFSGLSAGAPYSVAVCSTDQIHEISQAVTVSAIAQQPIQLLNKCTFDPTVPWAFLYSSNPPLYKTLTGSASLVLPVDATQITSQIVQLAVDDSAPVISVNNTLVYNNPSFNIASPVALTPPVDLSSLIRGGANTFSGSIYNKTRGAGIFINLDGYYATSGTCGDRAVQNGYLATPTVPPAPTNLVLTPTSTSTMNLSWASGRLSTKTFEVAYAEGTTPPSCSGGTSVGANTSYQLTGLKPSTTYAVSVCALNVSKMASVPITGTQTTMAYYTAINVGGPATGLFQADTDFSGGTKLSSQNSINLSNTTNAAPVAVYQSNRFGNNMAATIPGLVVGAGYGVRLHFAETYFTTINSRLFNVLINGVTVLTDYDIVADAGGANIAVTRTFTATANASGDIVIQFENGAKNNAQINGIEVFAQTVQVAPPPAPTGLTFTSVSSTSLTANWNSGGGSTFGYTIAYAQGTTAPSCSGGTKIGALTSYTLASLKANTPYAVSVCALNATNVASSPLSATQTTFSYYLGINVGGAATGLFSADSDIPKGTIQTVSSQTNIVLTNTSHPAPAAVYRSDRYGAAMTATIPNLTAGASYQVRLHFAELYWSSANSRLFNVSINGIAALTNFDIFATAGGKDIAVAVPFSTTATSSGTIVIQFTTKKDNAQINGIEIFR